MIRHSRTFTNFIAKFYQDLLKKLRNNNTVNESQSLKTKLKILSKLKQVRKPKKEGITLINYTGLPIDDNKQ
jgi:hypothetical protein